MWWNQVQTRVKQPNPRHGYTQRHRSNQVQSVHWILDEAEAALQQAPRVKLPDFAWVMLRLIRVPVTASRSGSEHKLQQKESSLLAFSPSFSLCILFRQFEMTIWFFCCIPRRHSDQRLSNLDLMPTCYIYEPRWMCFTDGPHSLCWINPSNFIKGSFILPALYLK